MFYFITTNFRLFLANNCRPIYCILCGRHEKNWAYTRYICNFICGLFFAWLLWLIFMVNFDVSPGLEYCILIALMVLIGFGFAFQKSIRCVTLLVFVAVVGKSGRSCLRALCFAFVIAGPIKNLSANGEEIVRVFACSTILSYNLTRTRFDLMTKPFQNTLAHMKDDIQEVQHTFAELRNVFDPIRNEVEGDDLHESITNIKRRYASSQSELIQNKYQQKFKKRCKQQLVKGQMRCREAFSNARDKCMANFPYIVRNLLCWPFQVDFVCSINILGNPDKVCDPSDAIPSDFGENYVNLYSTQQKLFNNASNVEVKYTLQVDAQPTLKNAEQTAKKVLTEFKTRKVIFDHVMKLMQRILTFLFIRVIYASMMYYMKYNKQIDFDNIYISEYFKHIDLRRKTSGKRSILPLKKYERVNLIDLDHPFSHTKEETNAVLLHLVQFSLEVITACFFLLLDYLIVTLMEIIRLRSKISYSQEGEHIIKFHIEGTGLLARLLRSTLQNFNMHERVSTFLTNEPCLPKPHVLPQRMVALYCGVVVLIYESTTFLRMRRLICGYFYRKREKQRVLYLYNSLLKQRRSIFKILMKNAQANIPKRQIRRRLNLLLKLRIKCPVCFDWLIYFKVARRKCVICDALEDQLFVICSNTTCGIAYCDDCWKHIGTICLACNQRIKILKILNFRNFFEEFLFT